jgi:hypothetical protein
VGFGDEILACPDLFPARRAGEPWGDGELVLDFVGAVFRFSGLSAAQTAAARRRFAGVIVVGTVPGDVTETRVFRVDPADFLPFAPAGREYRLDLDPGPDAVRMAGVGFMARFEWRPSLAGGLWTDSESPERFPDVLENYLRPLAAYRLLDDGTLFVHSAALVAGGSALLFPGRSGAGKSTLSGLAGRAGWTVLSDELNAVRAGGEPARVTQVPFAGDHGKAARVAGSFPLRAIGRLRQAASDAQRPIGPAEALALLYAATPYLNLDPWRGPRAEALLADLAARVPAVELAFHRGSDLAVLNEVATAPIG